MGGLWDIELLIDYLGPYLPYTVGTLVFFSIGLIGILTYFVHDSFKKSTTQTPAPKPVACSNDDEKILVLRSSKITEFLSLFGYFPIVPMARSFVKAMEVLREGIGGPNFRYKLPWFLVIGAENSGKTTLLQNANLPLPLGNPLALTPGEKTGCTWTFFDKATVIDVQGSFLIQEKTTESNDKDWRRFFSLLSHFRVRRPTDGIILTIPVTEIYGSDSFDRDVLINRAVEIYKKLIPIEHKLGLNVPVYVVITKCDLIPGFKSFANALNTKMRSEIFGYSSSYDFSENFQGGWIDEAFDSIDDSLKTAQLEIFSEDTEDSLKDGIMEFPGHIATLRENIQLYLANIFRNVGYREAFFYRGLYFTGDMSWQPEDGEDLSESDSSGMQPLSAYKMENVRNVVFVTELLRDKVFPEHVMARPGIRRLIASSRAINITRVVMVALFIVLGLNITTAYHNVLSTTKEIYPVFKSISITLKEKEEKQSGPADEFNTHFFDTQAKTLLSLMAKVENTQFFFWMLPPSWTGHLLKKMGQALTIAYDKIFLQSLYFELINKTRSIIEDPLPFLEINLESVTFIHPLATPEFLVLNGYVTALKDLELNIQKYNRLGQTRDIKQMGDIINFLFGFDLPKSMYENAAFYQKALSAIDQRPINIDAYIINAQERLRRLFAEFSQSVLGKNASYKELISLANSLNNFEKVGKLRTLPLKENIRFLLDQVNVVNAFLSNPDLAWINYESFNPGEEYNKLIGMIYESSFLGQDVADSFVISVEQAFTGFKGLLASVTSDLTGPFFDNQQGRLVAGPSIGLLSIQKAFSDFLSMPFMQDVDDLQFETEIPSETNLFWDASLIDEALDIVNKFNVFLAEQLPVYPVGLQESFKLMGKAFTQKNINSHIARAQSFVNSSGFLTSYAVEDSMRNQVVNIQAVLPTFMTLMEALETGGINQSFVELRNLLSSQLTQVLGDVDQVFESEGLYEPMSSTFSEWEGGLDAAFKAYNVPNIATLQAYLDFQRERVSYLTIQYAAPLLNFLGSNQFHLIPENITLVTRWSLLFEAVNAYERKKPGNSIFLLQNFILTEMNTISLSNYMEKLIPSEITGDGDYFLQRLHELRSDMLSRCEELSGKVAVNHYDQIQTFFNNRLSGKFPFVGTNQTGSGYAEPQDIKAFFALYDNLSSSARAFLNNNKNYGISRDRALEFMIAMDDVHQFFEPFLSSKDPGALPTFDLNVVFRVNRAYEVGAQDVLAWIVDIGSSIIDLHTNTSTGVWKYGMPISISFQWASNGPSQPMVDQKQPNLSVNGTTATYTYQGPWALLELLLMQEAPATEFKNFIDPNPQTLLFTIPTSGTQTPDNPSSTPAKLFIRMTPLSSEKEGNTVLSVPFFPAAAPLLSS